MLQKQLWGKRIKTDVLILGTGASGVGAALRAAELKADVLMVGQGRLESSGCLGGGNDHFMAVLNTDAPRRHDGNHRRLLLYADQRLFPQPGPAVGRGHAPR